MTWRKRSTLVRIDNLQKCGDENAAKRQKRDHAVPQPGKENQTVRLSTFLNLCTTQKFHVVSQDAPGPSRLERDIKLNFIEHAGGMQSGSIDCVLSHQGKISWKGTRWTHLRLFLWTKWESSRLDLADSWMLMIKAWMGDRLHGPHGNTVVTV